MKCNVSRLAPGPNGSHPDPRLLSVVASSLALLVTVTGLFHNDRKSLDVGGNFFRRTGSWVKSSPVVAIHKKGSKQLPSNFLLTSEPNR